MTPLCVLYRDDYLLALDKPAGALAVAGRTRSVDPPLSEQVRGLDPTALPVHRLDRGTSGVLLFALGKTAHRALNLAFERRKAEKRYLALARGDLAVNVTCDLPLAEARKGGMRVAGPLDTHALPSSTDFVPLDRFGAFTLVEARPRTGRTHQIRVHLAAIGHPLALDERYGDARPLTAGDLFAAAPAPEAVVCDRTPLHAASLRLPHPSGSGWLFVESPLPSDLAVALELLRRGRRA